MSLYFWHVFTYATMLIFLIVLICRIMAISRLPLHLRWELAPIPHEKGKNHYGGSYFEDFEWWTRKQAKSTIAPVVYMLKEIFGLRGVWKHNRTLWPLSFALHAGLYLGMLAILLYILNTILMLAAAGTSIIGIFLTVASACSLTAFVLGIAGSLGLILRRALDADLREFSSPGAYFNLVLLMLVFASGLLAWLTASEFASAQSRFVLSILMLQGGISPSLPMAVHIVLTLLFILYLPFTGMLHFAAKYFMYHKVRWNDAPLDGRMQEKLQGLASQPITWSAPHVKADGSRSWKAVTTEDTTLEEKA
ncbi:MAG TPA: respiratory nitrate reductase subunit gamma [Dehalococcoidia bacterium]|nr:respiratory nitrate reductase subunit gamma [Dehalococcoidia bacterium]